MPMKQWYRYSRRMENLPPLSHGCGCTGVTNEADVTRCGCWAHMRRKWRDTMPEGATMENSKANGRNPYQYLLWVLSSMPYLDKNPSAENLEALMPWNMNGI